MSCFIICGLPYFITEMILSYGDKATIEQINKDLYAFLGGIAVANSAVNPYIFLLFSVNYRNIKLCPARTSAKKRQLLYEGSNRSSREFPQDASYTRAPMAPTTSNDALEMTVTVTTHGVRRNGSSKSDNNCSLKSPRVRWEASHH